MVHWQVAKLVLVLQALAPWAFPSQVLLAEQAVLAVNEVKSEDAELVVDGGPQQISPLPLQFPV